MLVSAILKHRNGIRPSVEREFERAIAEKREELRQLDDCLLRVRQLLQVNTRVVRIG